MLQDFCFNKSFVYFCQTPGLGLRLGVDFVFPLSQEQQQEQEPQPKSKLEFDTKDQVLLGTVMVNDV